MDKLPVIYLGARCCNVPVCGAHGAPYDCINVAARYNPAPNTRCVTRLRTRA